MVLLLLVGCDEPSPSPAPGTPIAPPVQGPESLAGAWTDALAVPVEPLPAANGCPDADGDGAPSALACPGGAPATLDCDDADPAVTPTTERWVPPGPFLMGSTSDQAGADEGPVHVVRLSGYCLDRTEVTAGAWSTWLGAEGRRPAGADVRGLDAEGRVEAGRERWPAEGVTWEEAGAWCSAHGKALPTEAQWEKAARGGCEGGDDPARCDAADLRPYPWGAAAPDCRRANHNLSTEGMPRLCEGDTVPVDALPDGAGPYGHLQLAGNVWEYVADAWHPRVYGGERTDPGGAPAGDAHVLRGGGWNTFSTNMRAANRFHDLVMGSAVGIRCARPTVPAVPDAVAPVRTVTLAGTISRADGPLAGRALYVTAFDAADADPVTGGLAPGRSPVAEARLNPAGSAAQPFSVAVPEGGSYLIFAALDDGTGAKKGAYVSASGSGGFGAARENPVRADRAVEGLHVELMGRPQAPPQAPNGPGAGPPGSGPNGPGAPQGPGRSGPQGPPPPAGGSVPPPPR